MLACGAVYSVWCCVQCVVLCTVCDAVYSVWCCVHCVGLRTVSGGLVLVYILNFKKFLASCCHGELLLYTYDIIIQMQYDAKPRDWIQFCCIVARTLCSLLNRHWYVSGVPTLSSFMEED